MAAEQLFGHDPSRPLKGDYVGAYVSPKGTYVPIIIHLTEVDGNGTLKGTFTVLGDWAQYIDAGPFHAGRYSQFGTIHLAEDVIQRMQDGTKVNLQVKIDGHFAAPTSSIGTIWATLIVTHTSQDGSSKAMATGTLSVAYTKEAQRQVTVTAVSNPWDDGN